MTTLLQEGGTWGIVIIVSAFMIQVLAFGTTASIGVYNIELLEYFDNSTVGVSLIASLNFGIFLGSGPIVSFLMTRMSYRKIALFGSFMTTLGLIGMPLLPYIPTMCLAFGVFTGFGSSCVYIPSHVLSGLYYDKYRSLATGVATSGSGLGGAVMPIVVGKLIEVYSWKGSFIVLAGLCSHLFIFSMLLLMPGSKIPRVIREIEIMPLPNQAANVEDEEGSDGQELPLVKDLKLSPLESEEELTIKGKEDLNNLLKNCEGDGLKGVGSAGNNKLPLVKLKDVKENTFNKDEGVLPDCKDLSSVAQNDDKPGEEKSIEKPVLRKTALHESNKSGSVDKHKNDLSVNIGEQFKANSANAVFHTISAQDSSQKLLNSDGDPTMPLFPPPLHAVGSRGSGYLVITGDSHSDSGGKQLSKKKGVDLEPKKAAQPKSSKHIYIFTNYGFNVYFINNIMWNASISIVTSFVPEYLRVEGGLSSMEAAWMLGAFGFGCFIGGVLGGVLGNFDFVNRQVLFTFALVKMGVMLILFPFLNGGMVAYGITLGLAGLAFGIILGLLVVVLTDLIGVESLGNGLGYLMLSNGLGTFIGPPMAGILQGATGGFTAGILLAGVLSIVSGATMLLMCCRPSTASCGRKQQSV